MPRATDLTRLVSPQPVIVKSLDGRRQAQVRGEQTASRHAHQDAAPKSGAIPVADPSDADPRLTNSAPLSSHWTGECGLARAGDLVHVHGSRVSAVDGRCTASVHGWLDVQ